MKRRTRTAPSRAPRWPMAIAALALGCTGLATAAALAPATVAALGPAPAAAQAITPEPRPDSLRVFLVTFGPGAAVWERFGHNALWIHDPAAGTDEAYHYGLFDMSEEGFLFNFLRGRMFYRMGDAPAPWMIEVYRRAGRPADIQELRLTQEQVRELQSFFAWNLQPENRVYRYDYFRDNCSTRIRDALDLVLDGALRRQLSHQPAGITYRGEAVALTAEDASLTTGMDLGLGPLADQPITDWELAFIPMRLRDQLRHIVLERDGASVPLVASRQSLPALGTPDQRFAEPPADVAPSRRAVWHLLLGLAIAAAIAGLSHLARHRADPDARTRPAARTARWTLAITGAGWGLLTGLGGLILLALWAFTDHEFAWRNENLLQANPLGLGLAALAPLALLSQKATRAAHRLALTLAALSTLGLLIHPLPLTPQSNIAIIALALPIHLAIAWTLYPHSDL